MRIHWGYGITTIYSLFAVVTVSFVAFAIAHPTELVSADYYEQSVVHDRHAAAMTRTAALGDLPDVDITALRDIRLTLPRSTDATAVKGTITLYRPSDAGADRSWPLAIAGDDGSQVVPAATLPAGRWIVKLEWTNNDAEYYLERAVMLP